MIVIISLVVMNLTSSNRSNITIIEKIIRDAFTPLQSGVSEFRANRGGIGNYFADNKSLQKQIDELNYKNQELYLTNQALREYEREAKRLQSLLELKNYNINTYDLLAAKVIARSPNNWYKYIIIDRGSSDGIITGMPVINASGLVGRVRSVSENSCQVALLTDREMAVGVIVQENRDTTGVVEGLGDTNQLRMINIPYYSTIETNNIIITSGLSQIYPPGIDIGVVDTVTSEPSGLLLSATIKPAVNFDRLEEVLVLTSYHPVTESDELEE